MEEEKRIQNLSGLRSEINRLEIATRWFFSKELFDFCIL
jgi:hypothetical protein